MTKFIAITSGKGGVGKTTTAINLASALLNNNHDSVVIDSNLSTPNIGLHLGIPNHALNFHDAIEGRKHIVETIFTHQSGIKVIPADLSIERMYDYSPEQIENALLDMVGHTNTVLMDTSAGIGSETRNIVRFCDEALIICNPNLSSVVDARKTINMCHEFGVRILGTVVTRFRGDEIDMSIKNIEHMLDYPVISIIPEDDTIRQSQRTKYPVCKSHPDGYASRSYCILANKIIRGSI